MNETLLSKVRKSREWQEECAREIAGELNSLMELLMVDLGVPIYIRGGRIDREDELFSTGDDGGCLCVEFY